MNLTTTIHCQETKLIPTGAAIFAKADIRQSVRLLGLILQVYAMQMNEYLQKRKKETVLKV